MERICSICQSATLEDQETTCSVCGAELPPAEAPELEEVQEEETLEELDLEELDDSVTPVRIDTENLPETDEVEPEDTVEPSEDAADSPPADAEDGAWDMGTVGGEASVDVELEDEEVEEIELSENELLCPECKEVVQIGSESCANCNTGTEYLVPCPACAIGIDKLADICPHCYTDLIMFKEQQEPITPAEPTEVQEPEPVEASDGPEPAGSSSDEPETTEPESVKATEPESIEATSIEPDSIEEAELGQNGDLSEKEKKKMLKKLLKEQKELEKQLKKGEITEDEFAERLDKIRMGNGFGPIGGYVLEEAETEAAESYIPDRREERAARRELIAEELAKERSQGMFNYYNLSLVTLFFFLFLALFVLMEFIFTIGNFTTQADVPIAIFFDFTPTVDEIISMPVLLFGVLITMIDAILHLWDRKSNLMLSLVPTSLMIVSLGWDTYFLHDFSLIIVVLALLIFMLTLDLYCIFIAYPVVLDSQNRDEFEMFLEKEEEKKEIQQTLEDEFQRMVEEEEEKLKIKDEEIDDIKLELESLGDQIQEEEEKLRMKEEEVSSIKSELDLKTQQMAEEEEKLRMKEDDMESLIQTELEKRADDMMLEEQEKLRMKEEELIKATNELDIQKNLFDDTREKLRMKEQQMQSIKTELENQMRQRMEEQDRLRLKEAAAKMLDRGKQKRVLFPFAAMVGQEKMKRALTLNAVYSEIGGVLIRGQKGTGKSVSVRGLAEILPDIEVTGCKFNCDPADPDKFCTECKATHDAGKLEIFKRQVQVVDLPLNITEDRLVGSIDIERILAAGEKSFEPGILAEAHRGILYVDEINLLDDYIVDILLDAASSGVVTIEREGMSISHPSKFIIVGSMNPEEGELRPQILDRLALQCDVVGIKDVEQRIQIVKRREAFTSDPVAFREQYESNRKELRERIDKGMELVPNVTTPPRIYKLIAQICLDFDVDGHRADIIIERAARANAAFEGRLETTAEDVVSAAAMALPHRMRRRPSEDEEFNEESLMKLVKSREAELED